MSESERTVIVTGAAHGIGAATARVLSDEGYAVVLADRDGDAANQVARETGGEAICCDVAREEDIVALLKNVLARHGRIDAIVSNAGIAAFASLEELTTDAWNTVLATNLTPAMLLAKHGEAALRESRGAMVLIASTRAHMSEADTHAYAATKGGLVALTHSLAISLGPDVRVNCVSPGWINVDDEVLSPTDHAQHPAGRVGRPTDIGHMVAYLLSAKADFITGAEFTVDGGMTRKMIYA
ncbi:SDR family oxidoreductase [Pararhizobium haloflavum]|uniref:SDR family oxidoreductase n=1 Tax=Pararhizobium haloflavum TaxID=2037914 RepID=UPI000C18E1B6|nr:SDR family oxidoreductase [Pararhizobium haloflavum]